jgi:hypothetical protein
MKKYLLCSLTYLVVSPTILFAQTDPKLDQSGFDYWYSYLKQAGLTEVRDSCVMGNKFNRLNISFWDNIVKDTRKKDRELNALKKGAKTLEIVEIVGRHYDSAMIAVMKELCSEVW